LSLSASPTSITQGNSSTISWTSINATSCTASNGWSGSKATSGYQSVSPLKETTYTLTCTGNGGNTSQSVTVNLLVIDPQFPPVPLAPTINNFSAIPSIITSGQSVSLSWSTSNATSCSASNGWSGKRSTSGSQTFFPVNSPTTYTLTCSSSAGSTSQSVTVAVAPVLPPAPPPPLTLSLSASPASITQGNSSTISWTSINATSCSASNGWSGSKATSGSQSVSPLKETTYTLTCTGNGVSTSQSVTVYLLVIDPQFPPDVPTVDIKANGSDGPFTIARNSSANITWTSTGTVSGCSLTSLGAGSDVLNPSQVSPKGSQNSGNITENTHYSISCNNNSVRDSVTINVPPNISFYANPANITSGQSSTLSWVSYSASTCTASGGWSGNKSPFGNIPGPGLTETVSPAQTTTYTLSCTGTGGSASQSVTITVPNQPPVSSQFSMGEMIRTTANVNVRTGPSLASRSLAVSIVGTQGTVIGGPTSADGYIWWEISFIGGINGWTVGNYLQSVATITPPPVIPPPVTPPQPSVSPTVDLMVKSYGGSFSQGPITVSSGQTVDLSWTSTNANSCTASGGWTGNFRTSGSLAGLGPLSFFQIFSITCYDSVTGLNATDSVIVNVLISDVSVSSLQQAKLNQMASAINVIQALINQLRGN